MTIRKQPTPRKPAHGWVPEVMSYLYKTGVGEDGEDEHGLFFTVVVTGPTGYRYRHQHQWANGGNVNKTRKCEDEANKLCARVAAAPKGWQPSAEHWEETDAQYGSEAYEALQHEYVQREREEDERGD